MKICLAQTRSVKGDIQRNIAGHKKLINLAVAGGADLIVFPELSLTGYEPTLAKELAVDGDDTQLDDFQTISDANRITIGVGIPTKNNGGASISMILFQPHQARQTYSKKHLHHDEDPFFVSGANFTGLMVNNVPVALAICYELSVPEHSENAFKSGAKIYLTSVAKSVKGIDKALASLSDIASKYSMTVLMSNCVGEADGCECAGKTSAWNSDGPLTGQLDGVRDGILIVDTDDPAFVEIQYLS